MTFTVLYYKIGYLEIFKYLTLTLKHASHFKKILFSNYCIFLVFLKY